MKKLSILLYSVILISTTSNIFAADFCVNSSSKLQNALAEADSNNQDDVIKVTTGTFTVPSGDFKYSGTAEAHNIEVVGGWTDLFGGNTLCTIRSSELFKTTIDGDSIRRGMFIDAHSSSLVSISNLTFILGKAQSGGGGGLFVREGSLLLEKNAFILNTSTFNGSGLWFESSSFKHFIRNNIFAANHTDLSGGAVSINVTNGNGLYFTNNTLVLNTTDVSSSSTTTGLNMVSNGTATVYIGNNIMWDNEFHDIVMTGTGFKYLWFNDFQSQTGDSADNSSGNISLDPQLSSEFLDYSVAITSPTVNAGKKPHQTAIDFPNSWLLGDRDVAGADREQGLKVDMGAFESTPEIPIFKNGFE